MRRICIILVLFILIISSFLYAQTLEEADLVYLNAKSYAFWIIPDHSLTKVVFLNGKVLIEDAKIFYSPAEQSFILKVPATIKVECLLNKIKRKFPKLKSAIKTKGNYYFAKFIIRPSEIFLAKTINPQKDKPIILVKAIDYQEDSQALLIRIKYNQINLKLELVK